jgi:hypothetical protein
MALETGTYISSLNSANPTGADAKSQGDDHIRLIKATLKATFPNITGTVTASHTELNTLVGIPTTRPSFLAYLSTDLQATGAIPFDTEVFDSGSNYNPATGRFVPPVTGIYVFSFHGTARVGGTAVNCYFRKAGSEVARIYNGAITETGAASATIVLSLTATSDYVDVYNDIASGLEGDGGIYTWFSGALLW